MRLRCSKLVADGFRVGTCTRSASIEVGGKHYCKQHDPAAEEARRVASAAAYADKMARINRNTVALGLRLATVEQLRAELARRENSIPIEIEPLKPPAVILENE